MRNLKKKSQKIKRIARNENKEKVNEESNKYNEGNPPKCLNEVKAEEIDTKYIEL